MRADSLGWVPDAAVVARQATALGLDRRRRWRPGRRLLLPFINFHTNQEAAEAYRRAHPGMTGRLFGQTAAVQAARQAFGGLLDPSNPQEATPQ